MYILDSLVHNTCPLITESKGKLVILVLYWLRKESWTKVLVGPVFYSYLYSRRLTLSLPRVINFTFLFQSLTRDISYSMENLVFDSLLRWKLIELLILTTSLNHFLLEWLGEFVSWAWEWKVKTKESWRTHNSLTAVVMAHVVLPPILMSTVNGITLPLVQHCLRHPEGILCNHLKKKILQTI